MEYFLTFKAKFDCILNINNTNNILNYNDEIKFKVLLENKENFIINITARTKSENITSLNYEIHVLSKENSLEIISNNIKVYELNNEYLIELYNDVLIKDINILYSSNSILAYNTLKTHILSKNLNLELPFLFSNFSQKKVGSLNCFELSNNNLNYLVLLNNNTIVFSDFYNEMKVEKNSIKILSNIHDIAKHGKLTTIDTQTNNKSEEIVYTQKEPKLVKNYKLIPVAFLQALKVENIKLMKYYLSNELKEIGSLENYKEFFGDFKKCIFKFSNNNIVANLFYKKENSNIYFGKAFNFLIKENKIDKIN